MAEKLSDDVNLLRGRGVLEETISLFTDQKVQFWMYLKIQPVNQSVLLYN